MKSTREPIYAPLYHAVKPLPKRLTEPGPATMLRPAWKGGEITVRESDGLSREKIEAIGSPLASRAEVHDALASTQERAKELALGATTVPQGTLVVSTVQTGGRGRLGRSWGSPAGGLWMSLVLELDLPPRLAPRVTPAAAVGVAKSLRGIGAEVRIKWPNDLLASDGAKICGILAESVETPHGRRIVLGIGLNANVDPSDLDAPPGVATSLRSELGRDVELLDLLRGVLAGLEFELNRIQDFGAILDDWRTLDRTLGGRVRVRRLWEVVQGEAVDLGPEGQLLIRTEEGVIEVFEGDVERL